MLTSNCHTNNSESVESVSVLLRELSCVRIRGISRLFRVVCVCIVGTRDFLALCTADGEFTLSQAAVKLI
jgi:hypothetical protein